MTSLFQPTRPLRGATAERDYMRLLSIPFQPTRPLRGATHLSALIRSAFWISTHAPLAGRDQREDGNAAAAQGISTHAPLAGRDVRKNVLDEQHKIFQPTRPLRGATLNNGIFQLLVVFQPTRPLRGATDSCA